MFMRIFGRWIRRLRVGRLLDWFWFTWAKLRSPGNITADAIPTIDWPFRLQVKKGGSIHIGKDVKFRSGFHAWVDVGGHLEIADNVMFNIQPWVGVVERIDIGTECMFGPRVVIVDNNHRFEDAEMKIWEQGNDSDPVKIGNNVWVGAMCTVTKDIGDDCVIGANSVVSKAIPARSVAAGVPAHVVRSRDDAKDSGSDPAPRSSKRTTANGAGRTPAAKKAQAPRAKRS